MNEIHGRRGAVRTEPLSKSEYQRVVFERFQELLARIGRDDAWLKDLLLDDLRRESTGADSSAKKIVEGWFKRRLLPDYWRYVLSLRLGVDEEWLAGKHDDLDGSLGAQKLTTNDEASPKDIIKSRIYAETGNRLRVMREALGYDSLRDFAAEIDVPEDRFGTYERGVSLLQMPTALLIKRRFGVTLEWIYDGDASGMPHALYEAITATLARRISGPPTSPQSIARRLKLTREALGLNQTQFCTAGGIAPNTYNQWERARGRPELDGAAQLCEAHGLTLDWIYRGVSEGLPDWLASKLD